MSRVSVVRVLQVILRDLEAIRRDGKKKSQAKWGPARVYDLAKTNLGQLVDPRWSRVSKLISSVGPLVPLLVVISSSRPDNFPWVPEDTYISAYFNLFVFGLSEERSTC